MRLAFESVSPIFFSQHLKTYIHTYIHTYSCTFSYFFFYLQCVCVSYVIRCYYTGTFSSALLLAKSYYVNEMCTCMYNTYITLHTYISVALVHALHVVCFFCTSRNISLVELHVPLSAIHCYLSLSLYVHHISSVACTRYVSSGQNKVPPAE